MPRLVMDEIEEKKLREILNNEKVFIDSINYSDEPVIQSIDTLNGYLLYNVPEDILKKLGTQLEKINISNNSTNYLGNYNEDKSYTAGNVVTFQNKNYICVANTPIKNKPTDTNFWQLDTNQNPKNMGNIHYSLAGHIKNQYSLYLDKELEDYIFYLCNKYFEKYPNFVFSIFKHNAIEENTNLNLKIYALWANFMKKHEFNPIHSHSGRLSFVIWYKIPYSIEDEIRHGPCKRVDDSNYTANFQFVHPATDESGIGFTNLRVDKAYEGKIILFPSYLCHTVYPFYTSDEYRVSVAGNIKYVNGA